MASPERPIAYVLGRFPQSSQTFIAREVRGLIAAGVPLQVFALGREPSPVIDPPDAEWIAGVRFVPGVVSSAVLARCLARLVRDPARTLRAFWVLLGLPHRPRRMYFRAVSLAMRAAWIADAIERDGGCRHVHGHFALAQTEMAMAVATLLDVPFSLTAHAYDIFQRPSALVEKMQAARFVVTCTAHNRDYLRTLAPHLPPDRIQLVYHGVDVQAVRTSRAPRDGPPVVIAAGRFIEKKGFDVLIAACALLRDRGIEVTCCIAGEGRLRGSFEQAVQRLGLSGIVELPGWIAPADLQRRFEHAAMLVMPSRVADSGDRDGLPNVVLEAMAAGLPVVATRVSGIPEAVEHGVTGLVVTPDNPAELADAIARLLDDRELSLRMEAAARERALTEFDLPVSAYRLKRLFQCYDSRQPT